jgi:hypothetical protein
MRVETIVETAKLRGVPVVLSPGHRQASLLFHDGCDRDGLYRFVGVYGPVFVLHSQAAWLLKGALTPPQDRRRFARTMSDDQLAAILEYLYQQHLQSDAS